LTINWVLFFGANAFNTVDKAVGVTNTTNKLDELAVVEGRDEFKELVVAKGQVLARGCARGEVVAKGRAIGHVVTRGRARGKVVGKGCARGICHLPINRWS
jgi:hypothetical protein